MGDKRMQRVHESQGLTRARSFLLGTTLLATCLVMPAAAQNAPAAAVRTISVPAGPLTPALNRLAAQTGLQVLVDASIAQGKTTRGAQGNLTPNQALVAILNGTGLAARASGPNAITIVNPASTSGGALPAGAIPLDTIDVQGETAWGPVQGIVATRSATGTKTDTPLIETPQSISVVTRDQVAKQGAQTVNEALRYTPGINTETRGSSGRYDLPTLRGFGGDGMGGGYRYLDGLRVFNTAYYGTPQFDPYNLERIEVIRGPASVLYGQSSPGGILSFVSKRPTAETIREVQVQTGSYGRLQGAFDLGGAVDPEGKFLYRLAGVARDTGAQIDHVKEQRVSISPALTWRPTADTTLTVLANYQRDPNYGWHGWVPAQGTFLPNPLGKISRRFYDGDPNFNTYDRTQASAGYLFEHKFSDAVIVRQNLRYMHVDVDNNEVYSTGFPSVNDVPTNYRSINRATYRANERIDALTLDNQVETRFETGPFQHTLLAGLDYQYLDTNVKIGYGTAPPIDAFNPVYGVPIALPALTQDIDQKRAQTGLYLQDQIKLDRWVISLGGRYDWVDSTNATSNPTTTTPAVIAKQNDRAFTGRAGLIYLFDNGVAPYASYSTSFEPLVGVDIAGDAFRPTKGEQYEAGLKYQPPGWNTLLTFAAFDLTQQNVRTSVPETPGQYRQLGEVRSRGFEIEAKSNPLVGLNMIASFTYQDVEITKDMPATVGGISNQGKVPYLVPTYLASIWADYTVQRGAFAGFGFGAGVRHTAATWADSQNTVPVPPYTLVDAGVSYDFGKLRPDLKGMLLSVNVKNLFDTEYVSGCAGRIRSCYWGNGRTFLATMTYRW